MSDQTTTKYFEFIPNLKISLEFIEAFFKYLPYAKKGELKYSLTYYYQDTISFDGITDIISEIERCINYQLSVKQEIDIPAEIVLEQEIFLNGNEINLFYHGQLIIHDFVAIILWSWYQSSPKVELRLNETISLSEMLSLFENYQIAIADIIKKHE